MIKIVNQKYFGPKNLRLHISLSYWPCARVLFVKGSLISSFMVAHYNESSEGLFENVNNPELWPEAPDAVSL